jgi:hypothetical protein
MVNWLSFVFEKDFLHDLVLMDNVDLIPSGLQKSDIEIDLVAHKSFESTGI